MRKRVLIAESSEITRQAAKTVLRQNGFEVIAVSSGDKAFQALEHSKPHLIIANSSLPGKKQVQVYPGSAGRTGAFHYSYNTFG
ncbi:MAG: response regulator [candidate division Zixibacteria bacterium]